MAKVITYFISKASVQWKLHNCFFYSICLFLFSRNLQPLQTWLLIQKAGVPWDPDIILGSLTHHDSVLLGFHIGKQILTCSKKR